ncbi:MAG: hypothetical protein JWM80_4513 [Cyanobacteria bacterium RYN_339]|nr:hypothetical protein [Cyanobacteria bacterium RYN_339]
MSIDNTGKAGPGAPLNPANYSGAAGVKATEAAPKVATDSLKVHAHQQAGAQAAKELAAAQLPTRGRFLVLHSQQDDWVRGAVGTVSKAYADLQVLEAQQADPMTARPQAELDAARAKVSKLAADLAAHDPRGVRENDLQVGARDLSLTIRRGTDVGDPPLRGTLTKEAFSKAKEAWAQAQHAEVKAGREAAATLSARAELLHITDYAAHTDFALDQAEKQIEEKIGPVQWGKLVSGLIEVGGAVGAEVIHQQERDAHKR